MSSNETEFLEYFEEFAGEPDWKDNPEPKIGDAEFSLYGPRTQPVVSIDREERYVDKKPIGEDPVKQHLGPGFKTITIVGEATTTEANIVDSMDGGVEQYVRTARWSGYGTILNTSTESLGKYYRGTLVYKYTVEMTEV